MVLPNSSYEDLDEQIADAEKEMEEYNQSLDDQAVYTMETYRGLEKLSDVLTKDVIKSLSKGDDGSQEFADNLQNVRDAASQALNVDPGNLSDEFLTSADNLDLMQKAAQGDVDALEQLRMNAGQDIIAHTRLEGVSGEEEEGLKQELRDLAAQLPDVEVGADIDDTPFIKTLQDMLYNSNLTVEDVNNILSAMGFDATVDSVSVPVPQISYSGSGLKKGEATWDDIIPKISFKTTQFPIVHAVKRGTGKGYKPVTGTTTGDGTGGGAGGGGGGRGGGGGGDKYEPKEKDRVEDEIDRYERVNAELDTLSNNLDIIANEQDRLVGKDMAKNMAEQVENLKQQVYWQEKKLAIQKDEAAEYRRELSRDYGIRFDDEGHITNYAAKYNQLLNNLNRLIDQYNKTTTESGQEALEKRIEKAQEEFDNYNDLIEKYDELVSSSIIESEAQIEEFYDNIEDLQIEAFETATEAVDNLKDLQESIIDFNAIFSGLDSDSPYRDMMTAFQNLKTYWDIGKESMNDYYDELIKRNNQAMKTASKQEKQNLKYQNALLEAAREQYGKGTFEEGGTGLFDMMFGDVNQMLEQMRQFNETGTSSIFGENSGSMYEVAQDIYDRAVELAEDYEGHIDDLRDAIIDAIGEIGDAMDERLEIYENINDELDHYMSIIEMIQGDQ